MPIDPPYRRWSLYLRRFESKSGPAEVAPPFAKMEGLWSEFSDNHSKFTEKGNKAAATRARKAVGELKKLVTEYRKASVAESKRS